MVRLKGFDSYGIIKQGCLFLFFVALSNGLCSCDSLFMEYMEPCDRGGTAYSPVSARHRQIRFRPDGGIESEGDGPREIYWVGIIDVLTVIDSCFN